MSFLNTLPLTRLSGDKKYSHYLQLPDYMEPKMTTIPEITTQHEAENNRITCRCHCM
jgi:hypothetical protein